MKNIFKYSDASTGEYLGEDSFKMLRYAMSNPGCELEATNNLTGEVKKQKFIKVVATTKGNDFKVIATVERPNGETENIECIVNKENWV